MGESGQKWVVSKPLTVPRARVLTLYLSLSQLETETEFPSWDRKSICTVLTSAISLSLFRQLPPCSKSFQEAQSDLNHTAAELNHSAGEVVHSSRGTSRQLSEASGKFSEDFDEFLDAGIEMAGHTQVLWSCS